MTDDKIPVLVSGAKGRMGREVVAAVGAESDLEVVGQTDLGDDLAGAIGASGARVVVDFTSPSAAVRNTEAILEAGARPVVGTTGFRVEDIERLQARAASLERGGLIAPNFAIGAVLLMKFAAEAARYLPDVEVIEMHHDGKLDAPSGTAMKTIEMISAARREAGRSRTGQPEAGATRPGITELVAGARGGSYLDIAVHSVRLPGYVAHEEVLFGGLGQTLTIRHDSLSRTSFMPGVILAVRKVLELRTLEYGLEKILG